jgi:prevent-host-death family protein
MVTRIAAMATAEQTHVPVHEAKAKFSEMIRRVGEGEEIVITSHGTPVAKMVPPEPQKLSGEAAVEFILELRRTTPLRATPAEIREWIEEGRR